MTLVQVTQPLLRQTLRQSLGEHPKRRLIGLRARGPWSGPDRLDLGAGLPACRVIWCPSSLAFREQLAQFFDDEGLDDEGLDEGLEGLERDADSAEALVLLTDQSEQDLGDDVRSRLPRRKLGFLDPWAALAGLHGIHSLSPRLRRQEVSWLAGELLAVSVGGLDVEATGFLSESAAWSAWLEHRYGIPGGGRSLGDVLDWVASNAAASWQSAGARDREAIREQLRQSVGVPALALLHLVDEGRAGDALALGLICRVVFDPLPEEAQATAPMRREVAARLESVFGHEILDDAAGRAWAEAAEARLRVLWRDAPDSARNVCGRAERLLEDLRATGLAQRSDYLESALAERRHRLAEALQAALAAAGDSNVLEAAEAAAGWLLGHHRLRLTAACRERSSIEMSLRLLRWLTQGASAGKGRQDLPSLGAAWTRDGSFADWARSELDAAHVESRAGGPELDRAFVRLLSEAQARRDLENGRWGEAVAEWFQAPRDDERFLGVEDILEAVVAPLAKTHPVLLVVIDGMSLPAFHELMSELQLDWMQIGEAGIARWGLTPLPSVTRVARTSLLSGRLAEGEQRHEVRAFAEHPSLVRVSQAGREPRLFHKGELRNEHGTDLAEAVRMALADPEQRVVAAVINAMDDHLYKGDQIAVRWDLSTLQPLQSLLSAARVAERAVILTADHGHVLDRGTTSRESHGGGERWRSDSALPESGEVRVQGPRVVTADRSIVVPWSEAVRYGGARRNGYHGGASLQEMLVPLAVLTSWDGLPPGWQPLEGHLPSWWEAGRPAPSSTGSQGARATSRSRRRPAQAGLFDAPPHSPPPAARDWLERLEASEGLRTQLGMVRSSDRALDYLKQLLRALDHHGGTLTLDAVRRSLNLSDVRLPSILATCSRILNLDGYEILEVDRAADAVRLHRDLLRSQFELDEAP